ncbi:MAG: uL15 family ribosomal protein [Prevotella sp.]|nr:uL15 family ribosomal protein [Staphylococcus sp.]MCM1350205.1 uL15 family ribosomal protein [Prevotella sp.]
MDEKQKKITLKRGSSKETTLLHRYKSNPLFPGPNGEDGLDEEKVYTFVDKNMISEIVEEPVVEMPQPNIEAALQKEQEEKERLEREVALQKEQEEKERLEKEAALQKEQEEKERLEKEAALQKEQEEKERRLAEERQKMEELQRVQVSVAEAKEMVSDETAETLIETEEETEKIFGSKKDIINLDVISKNFEAGEEVTVNTLKEKHLIDKNVCFVKVLARGILDKPLVVKAQDFSLDAAKMIQLTGGKVVILTKKKYFD